MVNINNTSGKIQYGGEYTNLLDKLEKRLKKEKDILKTLQKDMTENNRLFKIEENNGTGIHKLGRFYNIFSYLLLIISYILFGIASTIFINSCIHLNKASIDDIVNNKIDKSTLINQPIFEYLKPINYLSVDKFLLYFDDINTPFTWVIVSIIIVSVVCIFFQICMWFKNNNETEQFQLFKEEIYNKQFVTKLIPYIYLFIIFITFISNHKAFNLRLTTNIKIGGNEYKGSDAYKPLLINNNLLKELKNIIIYCINIDKEYDENYINSLLNKDNKTHYDVLKTKPNIILDIFTIYNACYNINKLPDKEKIEKIEEEYKVEKIKFINYIDEYFNILINDKSTDINYYARYYLLGLIKNNYKMPIPENDTYLKNLIEYRKILNTELIKIKEEIYRYYITVIVFYVIFLIIIMCLHYVFIINTIIEILFINKVSFIGVFISLIIIMGIYIGMFKK